MKVIDLTLISVEQRGVYQCAAIELEFSVFTTSISLEL